MSNQDSKGFTEVIRAAKEIAQKGYSVDISDKGIVISGKKEKTPQDSKTGLSRISPAEEKQIEKELKELLKPEGE